MTHKTNKILTRAATLLLVLCVAVTATAFAQEAMEAIGFSVQAVLPHNQRDTTGYFDLLMRPGDLQRLSIQVHNDMSVPLRVRMDITDAYSSASGLIAYGAANADTASAHAFSRMATLRLDLLPVGEHEAVLERDGNVLLIAPYASVSVPFEVTVSDAIDGQVLGGIVTTKIPDEMDEESTGFDIQSLYSYAIAAQLQTEDTIAAEPQFSAISATPTRVAGWDALRVTLQNDAPLVITGAQLSLRVLDAKGNEVFAHTTERLAFAPLSDMPYTLFFAEGSPASGTYRVEVALTYQGTVWNMAVPLDIP